MDAARRTGAQPATLAIAHRGGSAYAPENTMLAVRNAARLAVDAVEVDVRFSVDGEPVLIHDRMLDRTTDLDGPVSARTTAELQRCDAAYWWSPGQGETRPDPALPHPLRGAGVAIPTLRALLEYVAGTAVTPDLAIEVKAIAEADDDDRAARDAARAVASLLREHGLQARASILSFWPPLLQWIKRTGPALPTCRLTDSAAGVPASAALRHAIDHEHDGAGTNYDAPGFDRELMAAARTHGKEIYTYTVNTPGAQRSVLSLQPRGLISDWPACTMVLQGRAVPEQLLPDEALARGAALTAPCPPARGADGG